MDGRFSLEAPSDAVLQISYIGFLTQEVTVGNKNEISISLREDAEALDELVVVGYGTVKRQMQRLLNLVQFKMQRRLCKEKSRV